MSRPRDTDRKDRWYFRKDHPYYKYGYIFERNGNAYVFIMPSKYRQRLRKNLNIPFSPKNKSLALNHLETMIVDHHKPVNKLQEGMNTVYDLFAAYAKVKFPNYTANMKYKYTNSFNKLFPQNISIDNLGSITVEIELRVNELQNLYANNTLRKILQFVSTIFNYHVKRGVIKYNPIFKELFPEETKPKKESYSLKEVQDVYHYFIKTNKKEMAYLVEFISITGCRIYEALHCTWSDINDEILVIHGKGNIDRDFPIRIFRDMPILLNNLKAIKKINSNKLFHWTTINTPLLYLREANKKLNIKITGFHALRRFRENQLANEFNLPPRIVASLLGHTERVQKKHYLKELEGMQIEKIINKEIEKK